MKGFILWTLVFVFLWLAITAVHMGEYPIAVAMGGISFVFLWAAPSGSKKTSKSKRGAKKTARV